MGLRSPFGYVDYEVTMAETFTSILDKFCAHCHTNGDYCKGCKECPAGVLAFECKDYILTANESDKRFKLYASPEWQAKRKENYGKEDSIEEINQNLKMADEYSPECSILRDMKLKIKRIIPHPFFYIRHHHKYPYERPKSLQDFIELTAKYKQARKERLQKWGLWIEPIASVASSKEENVR